MTNKNTNSWSNKVFARRGESHLRHGREHVLATRTHTHRICIRTLLRYTGRESAIFFTSSFASIALLLQIAPLPPFTCGSGPKPEHSDCLYSGADEEIFGRLQHIPAMCSVLGSREEKRWILSISNRSSWSLRWANMWHRGYSRKYACVQLSTSEIIFCFNHMRIDHDIPTWPHPCSYESSSKKQNRRVEFWCYKLWLDFDGLGL